ncbi:tetratricopeptide repeat protein, partial [Candidatus Poribacteria bacterium]|nr:tetratricopeptide repeat protein [Candidatus Poribacteria bacterium]
AALGNDALAIQSFQGIIDDDPNGSYASQAVNQIGNLFLQRYQYKEAILSCRQLVNKYPNTQTAAIASYLVGLYLYSNSQYDEAIKSYLSFLENFPNSPYRVSALSNIVRLYLTRRQYDEAEKLLNAHLRQNPTDADAMEQLANLYKEQGKYNEAFNLYRAALEQNPNDADILKQLGDLYAARGQRDLALNEWAKIIQNEPNQFYRYQQLGTIYTSHQMYAEAIQVYETAIRLNPRSAYLYTQLADVYKIQGKIDLVIDTYLRALTAVDIGYGGRDTIIDSLAEIYEGKQQERLFEQVSARIQSELKANPQNPSLVLSLAELLFRQGRLDLALENFKRLVPLYPADRGQILDKYAQILERDKNPKAADFYQTIITLFPNSPIAWNSQIKLARLYEQMGRWQDALVVLTNMTRQGNDPSVQLLLGRMWLHGIRNVEAAQPIYQALADQPLPTTQGWEVRLRLAECHILREQYAAAQNILRPIAEGNGDFKAEARKLIGDSYLFDGRFEDAIKEYKSVLDITSADLVSNDALERSVLIQSNSDYNSEPLKRYVKALQEDLRGQTEEALKHCAEAIKAYPNALIVDDLWLLIGGIHQRRGRYTNAIEAYQQLISSKSLVAAEAQAKIADIYRWQLGDVPKALETYSALINNYPESVIVTYARQQIDEIVKLQSKSN